MTVLQAYLDEVEYYIERKWSHPHHSRMIVTNPDMQGTDPLSGWLSFHFQSKAAQLKRPSTLGGPGVADDHWDFACRALAFATPHVNPHSPRLAPVLVHRCASIADHCPVVLLEWIVAIANTRGSGDDDDRVFHGEACAATADVFGRLPLHRALECGTNVSKSWTFEAIVLFDDDGDSYVETDVVSEFIDATVTGADSSVISSIDETVRMRWTSRTALEGYPRAQKYRARIVKTLLKWHPRAAAIHFPNGRSPLVHAIANGGSWHTADFHYGNMGLLQLLWTHAPEQSLETDPITGLYPFMLAATVSDGRIEAVDNVYNLLRKDPQIVSCALLAANETV